MKKLVTALIIVLPLVLVIALFTATGIASISADIRATDLVIANKGDDGVHVFDMANYTPLYESDLDVRVMPLVAGNRRYSLSVTDLNGEPCDIVTLDADGAFRLHDTGIAKLTYTSLDGGYSDSVLFDIRSSAILDFTPSLRDKSDTYYPMTAGTNVDYEIEIPSGNYIFEGSCFPSEMNASSIVFECDNDEIICFNGANGEFNARYGGNCIATMFIYGAGECDPICKTVRLRVTPSSDITIDGKDATAQNLRLFSTPDSTSISFGIQTKKALSVDEISVDSAEVTSCLAVPVDGISNAFNVTLNLSRSHAAGTTQTYTLRLGDERVRFYVDFADRSLSVYSPTNKTGSGNLYIPTNSAAKITAVCTPHDENIKYEFSISDQDNMRLSVSGKDFCTVEALSECEALLTIKWTQYDGAVAVSSGETTRTVIAVNTYASLLFAENADSHGLGELGIATKKYENSSAVPNLYKSKFRANSSTDSLGFSDIEFTISDSRLAALSVEADGIYIQALKDGIVTVTAKWKYGDIFGIKPASLTFRAVNGVEVDSDESLRKAFSDGYSVVLTRDVYLGENLFEQTSDGGRRKKYDDVTMRQKLLQYTGELKTTADWQFYKNLNREQPSVRYCLDITENIYGNGYAISGQYITDMLDNTDNPYDFAVFKGPLDFVATSSEGIKLASVKGQDNIVFLVRKDGLTIDNTVLRGCDDETLYEDGSINLSLLNNMGTTLEIMSDATISRSRIMNGRTVLRVFGRDGIDGEMDVDAAAERINVTIDGCVLQNAREFIVKTGTNRLLRGNADEPAPSLTDAYGNEYENYNSPACDAYIEDSYFMSHYVLTDVTLKDCTLSTSGLFCIGLETHFAGPMLAGARTPILLIQIDGWHDLAGTSYPAALHLVGDVKLDNIKDIASVDSSTLIETSAAQDSIAFLSLNIAQMLKTVQKSDPKHYSGITFKKDGVEYVHGGIAFFGGGKNYSIIDLSSYTASKLSSYNINLSVLLKSDNELVQTQGLLLPLAAGTGDFRFLMDTSDTSCL